MLPKKMKENNGIYKKYNIEWIGREGLAPETHEEYLNDFINHFYKVGSEPPGYRVPYWVWSCPLEML